MSNARIIDSSNWVGISDEPPVEEAQRPAPAGQQRDLPHMAQHYKILNWSMLFQNNSILAAIIFVNGSFDWQTIVTLFVGLSVLTILTTAFFNWLRSRTGRPPIVTLDKNGLNASGWTGGPVTWAAVGQVTWHGPKWLRQLRIQVDPERTPPFRAYGWTEKLFGTKQKPTPCILLSGWSIAGIDENFARMIAEYRDNFCGNQKMEPSHGCD